MKLALTFILVGIALSLLQEWYPRYLAWIDEKYEAIRLRNEEELRLYKEKLEKEYDLPKGSIK